MSPIKQEYSTSERIVNLLQKLKPVARARVLAIVNSHEFAEPVVDTKTGDLFSDLPMPMAAAE